MYTRPPKASHLETIQYEMDMLEYCFDKLKAEPTDGGPGERHVYLECFLLHYRSLVRFFSAKKPRKKTDLSTAEPERWFYGNIRAQELDSLQKRAIILDAKYFQLISRYLEHLTVYRHEVDLEWDVQQMYEELRPILSQFRRLTKSGAAHVTPDPLLGLFADEPHLMDQVIESAMKTREEHPLRQTSG